MVSSGFIDMRATCNLEVLCVCMYMPVCVCICISRSCVKCLTVKKKTLI